MQEREKKKLGHQLEAQAKQLMTQDDETVLESMLTACGALLRAAGALSAELPGTVSTSVYASYLSIAQRISDFCNSCQIPSAGQTAALDPEALRTALEEVKTRQKQAAERQEEADALERQRVELSADIQRLESELEEGRQELQKQRDVETGLRSLVEDFTKERQLLQAQIDAQKAENTTLLTTVTTAKGELAQLNAERDELTGQRDSIAMEITQIQEEIAQIPQETVALRERYKELAGYLEELKTAETECSPEQQALLRQEIESLTPVVEEYQVAADILRNRLSSLKGQKTQYDQERHQLSTNVIALVQEAMEDLKTQLQDQEEFLGETERTAQTLAQRLLNCQKKRAEYAHWLDTDETPLTAMMEIAGQPESEQLGKTLDIGQVTEIKTAFTQIRQQLEHLDGVLGKCATAAQEDLNRLRQRANP